MNAQQPVSAPGRLADPDAAVKRAAVRFSRVAGGLDELEHWLHDQLRGGLAGLERSGYAPFDRMAARMVDAQAPGIASLLRALPGLLTVSDWPARLLEEFGALHLLIQAHRRLDELDDALAATVRSRIGYPVNKAEVLARPALRDHWWSLGAVETMEGRLRTRRVWLHGATTGRWAMLLSFVPPGGQLIDEAVPGRLLHADLHVYPGSGQYRGLLGRQHDAVVQPRLPAGEGFSALLDRQAALLGADPWASRMPAVVCAAAVPPTEPGGTWRLRDDTGEALEVTRVTGEPWSLLARSMGHPIPIFGELAQAGFRPLSLLPDDRGRHFDTSITRQAV